MDDELLREIRDDVLVKTLWISPDQVRVKVERGEVELSGRVETKAQAELVAQLSSRVPGVLAVTSSLHWEYDEGKPGRGGSAVGMAGSR